MLCSLKINEESKNYTVKEILDASHESFFSLP